MDTMKTISIRPGYITYALSASILMTVGSALVKEGFKLTALACFLSLIPIGLSAAFDRIEFDGLRIRKRGLSAVFLKYVLGIGQQLSISDIEAITTETTSLSFATGDARLIYHTRISGIGIDMTIRSRRSTYAPFIKALFQAVGPHR